MMFYKYLIFTYIICNDCILSNFNICTKEGVSKLKVTDILLFLGTDYTEKHRERRIIIREIPCNPYLKESNSLI